MRCPRRLSSSVTALALVLGVMACGGDGEGTSSSTTGGDDATATTTTEVDGGSSTGDGTSSAGDDGDVGAPTTSDEDGPTASDGDPSGGPLPGEVVEAPPYGGATLSVVGVEADDTLNVREGPGTAYAVVLELDPRSVEAVATGHNRVLDDGSTWAEVDVGQVTGWAAVSFLAQAGESRDITDEVTLPPGGGAPAEVALDIAGQRSPDEPTPTATVVHRTGEVGVVDLLGIGDDSVRGERITVTVEGGTFSVTSTVLCARGVTGGLCL